MLAWMTSCSSYNKHQDEADKNGPVDCVDLHVRNAEWHFIDRGVRFDVFGTCKKGMRHGNFRFFADGHEVAVVFQGFRSQGEVCYREKFDACFFPGMPFQYPSAGKFFDGFCWRLCLGSANILIHVLYCV